MAVRSHAIACLFAVLVVIAGVAVGEDPAPVRLAAVDAIVGPRFPADEPGAVVLVARQGVVLHFAAYGMADLQAGRAMTVDGVFDMASCSKQFTAMAVMQLAHQGSWAYGDRVRQYLPELPGGGGGDALTIADLLHMASGLPDYTGLEDNLGALTNAGVLRLMHRQHLGFPPGQRFDYCNTNYALLALMVERQTGKQFADVLAERIFAPLKMTHTLVLDHAGEEVPGRVQGYVRNQRQGWKPARQDTGVVGDGQVMSCAADLLRWDAGLRANTLLAAADFAPAIAAPTLGDGKRSDYGFGWEMTREKRHHVMWHSGGWTGTSTYISRDLDGGLLVVVLSNRDGFPADQVGTAVAEAMLKP
jgi:CubicO group peptidase (beta-lactamase class C family)